MKKEKQCGCSYNHGSTELTVAEAVSPTIREQYKIAAITALLANPNLEVPRLTEDGAVTIGNFINKLSHVLVQDDELGMKKE